MNNSILKWKFLCLSGVLMLGSINVFGMDSQTEVKVEERIQEELSELLNAVKEGSLEKVQKVFNSAAVNSSYLANYVNDEGTPILQIAIKRNSFDIVKYLVEQGGLTLINATNGEIVRWFLR